MIKLKISNIALKNVKHQKTKTVGSIILIAVLSFILLSSSILSLNLNNGIACMKNRLGADLIVVPMENIDNMEDILLQGTPSKFYFDKSIESEISRINGVEKVASQFYLQSLSASCCSFPVQLIGYDKDADFTVIPWIDEMVLEDLDNNSVVVGSEINLTDNGTIKLFWHTYNVAATLEKTGTGLDYSVYADADVMKIMYENSISKGVKFDENITPDTSISSIMVRLADDADIDEVVNEIYDNINDVTVIKSKSITRNVSDSIYNLSKFINIYMAAFLVISVITLYIVSMLSVNTRKKDFAVMRILGASNSIVRNILLLESFYIGLIGSVIGSAISFILMTSFDTFIEDSLGLPYVNISAGSMIMLVIINLVICTFAGVLSAVNSIRKFSKAETFIVMREDG